LVIKPERLIDLLFMWKIRNIYRRLVGITKVNQTEYVGTERRIILNSKWTRAVGTQVILFKEETSGWLFWTRKLRFGCLKERKTTYRQIIILSFWTRKCSKFHSPTFFTECYFIKYKFYTMLNNSISIQHLTRFLSASHHKGKGSAPGHSMWVCGWRNGIGTGISPSTILFSI
jgi:hypothetical protein